MTRTRTLLRVVVAATLVGGLTLAAAPQETRSPYVEDPDPLVRQKIDEWQDLKLGLLMHWGTYSQWGIVESWSLCSEDEPWCRRSMDDYATYKAAYEKLQTTFNPVQFRSGALGEGRARCGDAIRRVHDQAPRRLQHVRHAAKRTTASRRRTRRSPPTRAPTSRRAIFDAFRARGLQDRRVLLEARLAQSRLLVAVLRDARSESELRHQEVSRALGPLRRRSRTRRSTS